jgi:flagellar biosynthesis/type III secretory pathway protein FliH
MSISNPWETIDDSIKDAMREGYEAGYEAGYEQGKKDVAPKIIYCEQCANHDMCALEERTEHEIMFCGLAKKKGEAG